MKPIRIRHRDPSQTVASVTFLRAARAENIKSITNPSQPVVTDSESRKYWKSKEKENLSLSISNSVTCPRARCLSGRARTREGGGWISVTDSNGGAMQERCDQCRFFRPNPPASRPGVIVFSGESVFGGGECRRRSPVWRGHELAQFPLVACEGWCGEFVHKSVTDGGSDATPET